MARLIRPIDGSSVDIVSCNSNLIEIDTTSFHSRFIDTFKPSKEALDQKCQELRP